MLVEEKAASALTQDAAARQRALDVGDSFIVQAPAGSGKTELLTQRFLRLLTVTPSEPEEVLAITFTRKAASEMRQRVMDSLHRAATQPEPTNEPDKTNWRLAQAVLVRDKQLNWQLRLNPNRLRMMTIDSLCNLLVKQMPIVSELGGVPAVTDDPVPLYEQAAERVMAPLLRKSNHSDDTDTLSALLRVTAHLDNQLMTLRRLMVAMLGRRDQWLLHVVPYYGQGEALREHLQQALGVIVAQRFEQSAAIIEGLFDQLDLTGVFDELLAYAAVNLTAQGDQTQSPLLVELDDPASYWGAVSHLLTTANGTNLAWRKPRGINKRLGFPPPSQFKQAFEKDEAERLKSMLSEILAQLNELPTTLSQSVLHAMQEIRRLPTKGYSDEQWQCLDDLILLMVQAVVQLRVVFQQQGAIDFSEMALAAQRALGGESEPTELALKMDRQIHHILLDEFQDTSNTQYQLLLGLTRGWMPGGGRTLFLVGDPMQSIYRFREAEVGLFLKARDQGLGEIPLTFLRLERNFRSDPTVIEWVNQHFQAILPDSDSLIEGAVCYSASLAAKTQRPGASVNCRMFVEDEHQYQTIVSDIARRRHQDPNDSQAILIRARAHATGLIAALKAANIPYQAVEIDGLAQKQQILDLMALSRALYYWADEVAWLAVLRAPWCGLGLTDLYDLLASPAVSDLSDEPVEPGDDARLQLASRRSTIWERCLAADESTLSPSGWQRLQHLIRCLEPIMRQRYRFSVRATVEAAWLGLGAVTYTKRSDLKDAQTYFELLERIEQYGDLPAAAELQRQVEQLYAAPDVTHDNPVQIMTIHKSKGLEFDAVYLPHAEKIGRYDDAPLLAWLRQEDPLAGIDWLLLAPISGVAGGEDAIYQFIRQLERRKATHELGRLFYVAATRAKSRLLLTATINDSADGDAPISAKTGSILDLLCRGGAALEAVGACDDERHPAGVVDAVMQCEEVSEPDAMIKVMEDHGYGRQLDRHPAFEALLQTIDPGIGEPASQDELRQSTTLEVMYQVEVAGCGVTESELNDRVGHAVKGADHAMDGDAQEIDTFKWKKETGIVLHRLLEALSGEQVHLTQFPAERFMAEPPRIWQRLLLAEGVPPSALARSSDLLAQAIGNMVDDSRGRWVLTKRSIAENEFALYVRGANGAGTQIRVDRFFVEAGQLWIVDYKLTQPGEEETWSDFFARQFKAYQQTLEQYVRAVARLPEIADQIEACTCALYFPLMQAWLAWDYRLCR